MNFEPVIGFEIHVELKTASKMFCGCVNDPFGAAKPNIYTCPVCLGLPGALPVPNRKAVEWTIQLGIALGCSIPAISKFDRKHYFYPDLPKGYQISQYDMPLAVNGKLELDSGNQGIKPSHVRIRRVHLEEDTAKLIHGAVDGKPVSFVDFNRSGVPLVEIVTEPDIQSSIQAKEFLKKIQRIIRYLDISDADMEKGSMRLEPNISVREITSFKSQRLEKTRTKVQKLPNYKVEVKNINSFRFVAKAIEYEVKRQTQLLKSGKTPAQENRGWSETKGQTVAQRIKEEAEDYRYFPEPDIPPMRISEAQILKLKSQIPELPDVKVTRFINSYGLNAYDAGLLTESRKLADYFEETVRIASQTQYFGHDSGNQVQKSTHDSGNQYIRVGQVTAKQIANWVINKKVDIEHVAPQQLLDIIRSARQTADMPPEQLARVISDVISQYPKAVADYKAGKAQAFGFLLGQIKRKHPGVSVEVLSVKLKESL